MLKVIDKDTRMTSFDVILVSLLLTFGHLQATVFIVNSKYVIAFWEGGCTNFKTLSSLVDGVLKGLSNICDAAFCENS